VSIKKHLRVCVFLYFLVFASCAAFRPAEPAQEIPFAPFPPFTVGSASPGDVVPLWQPLSLDTDAVLFFAGRTYSPRIEFWAVRLDMAAEGVGIVVKGGAEGGAGSGADSGAGTFSSRVSTFVADNGLLAGINALPFNISTAEDGLPIRNVGIVVSEGELVSAANPNFYALVWYYDGGTAIVAQSQIEYTGNIQNAVGGFHQILEAGELTERAATRRASHPRTAAGICQDGRFLYLLVIDGRRRGSAGATEAQTAQILKRLGAHNGINFDGGGSSAMAARAPDDSVWVLNTPVHGGVPGRERAVAGSLGVRLLP